MSSSDSAASDALLAVVQEQSSQGIPPETRALVDGIGVYTASCHSPFLTAPAASPTSVASDSVPNEAAGTSRGRLADLEEPLRRQIRALPLRSKVSEEEVSGLVAAVLSLIARHLPLASDAAHTKL